MKKYVQVIIAAVITILGMIFVYRLLVRKDVENGKSVKTQEFINEYKKLNGKVNEKNGKSYPIVEIDDKVDIIYDSEEEIIELIKNGTGVIYFGYPECPWCRNMIPVLLDSISETSLEELHYLNVKQLRDSKVLDAEGKIVVENKGSEGYKKIVELLYDYLPVYSGLNDDTIKRLYVPTVVFVRNGTVVAIHFDTVESQEDPYIVLNDAQKLELKEIYLKGIHKVLNDLCDESC